MSSAYTLARKVILTHKKTREYLLNMLDVYYAVNRLTDEEYTELVNLVYAEYPEN